MYKATQVGFSRMLRLCGWLVAGRLSRARGPMNAQNGDSAAQDQGPGGPGKRTRERTRERSQTAAAPSE